MNETETTKPLAKAESTQLSLDSTEPVLKGIALWQLGHSMREAARMAGCAPSSICTRMKSLGLNADERKPDREAVLRQLEGLREEAARQLGEALKGGKIKEGQLPVVTGILTDKVAGVAGWNRPSAPEMQEWLKAFTDRLATVKVELRDPADEAVDVTAEKAGEEA